MQTLNLSLLIQEQLVSIFTDGEKRKLHILEVKFYTQQSKRMNL